MAAKVILVERRDGRNHGSIPGLRWVIVGLIFLVTCINYIDRSSVGLLVTRFGPELHISTRQYGYISSLLLLAYTVSQSVSGRLYDRFGARIGFSVSILVWCAAAMAHSLITGVVSFACCSFFLGLGEAGNWPGAAKVIAEWFPQRERATGMAIFNGGASMGGVIAPLLVAGFLEPHFGWRTTFLIIGALGFAWLALWLAIYRPLFQHPRLSAAERAHIREGQPEVTVEDVQPVALGRLLRLPQTWSILLARFCVDPVWWLYMLWLPTYLKDVRHFSLKDIGLSAWLPYAAAAAGALFGGWLAGALIHRGWSVNAARKTTVAIAAAMMPFGILAARAQSAYAALACIAVVLFGFQMWISNVQTLPSDFFSHRQVGVVAGMGGTAAGIASLLFNLATAPLAHRFGYGFVLTVAGVMAPVGLALLLVFAGRIERVDLGLDPGRDNKFEELYLRKDERPMSDLSGKFALVFGGGRDIGAAVAVELAAQGAEVALSYLNSDPRDVLAGIERKGGTVTAYPVDALDTAAVRGFAREAAANAGKKIDVLANVVGGLVARKKMDEMDDAFWDHVFALNVKSVFAMTQAALPLMNDGGAIVNVASQAGRDGGGPGSLAYGASKGALMSMTRGLAKELGARRIRVNAVCPGMIATKFHDDFTKPEVRAKVAGMTPLGREGEAAEVGTLVAFLAAGGASFVNGACVDVNGGLLFS